MGSSLGTLPTMREQPASRVMTLRCGNCGKCYLRDVAAGKITRRRPLTSAEYSPGGVEMGQTPSTIFVILMFPVIFVICILWATHGHTSNADNEDLSVTAKDH